VRWAWSRPIDPTPDLVPVRRQPELPADRAHEVRRVGVQDVGGRRQCHAGGQPLVEQVAQCARQPPVPHGPRRFDIPAQVGLDAFDDERQPALGFQASPGTSARCNRSMRWRERTRPPRMPGPTMTSVPDDQSPVRFDTKIAVLLRDDLAGWQRLNVCAFLASGIAAAHPELIGAPYADADDTPYLAMFGQPVLVLAGGKETQAAHARAVDRGLPMSISPRRCSAPATTATTGPRGGPCARADP
jgi:Protein of unknown function (DUF2000)